MAASKYAKLLRARRKRDEYLSKAFVKKIAKPCPTCGMAIEKNEGCVPGAGVGWTVGQRQIQG